MFFDRQNADKVGEENIKGKQLGRKYLTKHSVQVNTRIKVYTTEVINDGTRCVTMFPTMVPFWNQRSLPFS